MEFLNLIEQLTNNERLVFDYFCTFARKKKEIYFSQEHIAERIGITRETCNRIIKRLKGLGFLTSTYRLWRTCFYQVSPFIWVDTIRFKLSKYFPSLRFFSVQLLKVTLCINTGLLGNKYLLNRPFAKEGGMEHGNPIPPCVRAIKNLKLSRWGQIRLSAFPAEALAYVDQALSYSKNVKDPFRWFEAMCNDFCKRENMPIDWDYSNFLSEKYGMKENSPLLLTFDYPVVEKKKYSDQPFNSKPAEVSRDERRSSELRLKLSQTEIADRYKFRKWTKQLETANEAFASALRDMICALETIEESKKAPYRI